MHLFFSQHSYADQEKRKVLGSGYYFFDNNMAVAYTHGNKRYKRKYMIFEAVLELKSDDFLDLVGNPISMLWLQEVMKQLSPLLSEEDYKLGHFIAYLKRKDMFPFAAIRVVDNSIQPDKIKGDDKIGFRQGKANFANVNPIFILCLLKKDPNIIQSFHHKFTK